MERKSETTTFSRNWLEKKTEKKGENFKRLVLDSTVQLIHITP